MCASAPADAHGLFGCQWTFRLLSDLGENCAIFLDPADPRYELYLQDFALKLLEGFVVLVFRPRALGCRGLAFRDFSDRDLVI